MSRIIKKEVLKIYITLTSPLNLSSGESEITDTDIIRDWYGKPFVPGSSLAGAMRAYLDKAGNEDCIMGYSGEEDAGKMSPLFVSDITFGEKLVSGIRDGVKLNNNKTAETGSKYDIEILETGAKGWFYVELTVRENDNEASMKRELALIIKGINSGEICLGSKKTRGFGQFIITQIKQMEYAQNNYLEYASAYTDEIWEKGSNVLQTWIGLSDSIDNKMLHIKVPLKLDGGISIRKYGVKKGQPDFVHLTSKHSGNNDIEVPVIPGSSFAGAIRHRVKDILVELSRTINSSDDSDSDNSNVNMIMNRAFGYVNGNDANISNVIIRESEIADSKPLTMVRTGVSRLESNVKTGALYKERTYVEGRLTLDICVRKNESQDEQWIIGLLLLALKDIQNGLLAVGGETAIGRGFFCKDGAITIDGQENLEDEYIGKVYQRLSDCLDNGGE